MDDDWDIDESPKPSGASTPAVAAAPPKAAPRKKWDDEDAEDEQDDWDASEDEKPKASANAAPGPVRKKKLKEKLAEKERLAREGGDEADFIDGRTEQDRRREAREREMEADLATAADLMGSTGVEDAGELLQRLIKARPTTKDEFEDFGKDLMAAFITPQADKPLFPAFAESFAKLLCDSLSAVQVRKVSSGLSTLGNTKQQEERDKASGKKKGSAKPKLGIGKTAAAKSADIEAYDADDVLADDDFM